MKSGFVYSLAAAFLSVPFAAHAQWQAVEQIKTYAIEGNSGASLYASIGQRGPEAGPSGRAIAHTTFKLTWTRKYEPQGNACVLVTARPKLIITYTLPRPAAQLSGSVKSGWDVFVAGIEKHERVHGQHIKEMVAKIEAMSVGLTAPDDPGCRKIRIELTGRLGELSNEQRQRGRDFDRVEMSDNGTIRQLVLNLVNGH